MHPLQRTFTHSFILLLHDSFWRFQISTPTLIYKWHFILDSNTIKAKNQQLSTERKRQEKRKDDKTGDSPNCMKLQLTEWWSQLGVSQLDSRYKWVTLRLGEIYWVTTTGWCYSEVIVTTGWHYDKVKVTIMWCYNKVTVTAVRHYC